MKCDILTVQWLRVAALMAFALEARPLLCQVAITEVMSSRLSAADFFELTNFGTNAVDLAGYHFTDGDHRGGREPLIPVGESLYLRPGESAVFVRTNLSEAEFRAFWGDCFPSDVKLRQFPRPGFSSYGDALTIYDGQKAVVDHVEFLRSYPALSFTYDPLTGAFGVPSSTGASACLSLTNGSVASPGKTTGPVPLQFAREPADVMICPTLEARFSVEAFGMPRPHYQWFFNGTEIPGARGPDLVVSNALPETEGVYSVRVSNGVSNLVSSGATLRVDTTPRAPLLVRSSLDLTVVEGRTARFAIEVCAEPPPSYRWLSNGVLLADQTNRVLFVRNATADLSGTSFCVTAENPLGAVTNCYKLFVTNSPPLRITELQASPQSGCDGHNDWFEVTNFGSTDVQMFGYRFSDQFDLREAFVINRPLLVRPRESVIFVKNASAGSFFDWWGPDQLPENLQVVPFSGFSLSSDGDTLYLWSDTAEDPEEYLASVPYTGNAPGKSLDLEFETEQPEDLLGLGRAIKAVECGDIGSPGFTSESRPEFINILQQNKTLQLSFRARGGSTYRIDSAGRLEGPWTPLRELVATNIVARFEDPSAVGNTNRFYRLTKILPR